MQYFMPVNHRLENFFLWKVDGAYAVRVGVPNAETTPNSHLRLAKGETFKRALTRTFSGQRFFEVPFKVYEVKRAPGEFYPRIARPSSNYPFDAPGSCPDRKTFANALASSLVQMRALTAKLAAIFQIVHPSAENANCFGHEIRNLMLLACTEVESQMKGIMLANGYSRVRFTMNDYVKLQNALKLDQYAASFPGYPWWSSVRPFEKWKSSTSPTKDLPWYAAYNSVKHDREAEFHNAKLQHAADAVCACIILLVAQFGKQPTLGFDGDLGSFIRVDAVPKWDASEVYIAPSDHQPSSLKAVEFPF